MKRNESFIMTYCRLEEQEALLTGSGRELYEDVESSSVGLFQPELRDPHPLRHAIITIVIDCDLMKGICSLSIKIYVDLQNMER